MPEKTPLERVEDLLNAKFAELEKRLADRQRYEDAKTDEIKDRLNSHALRIRDLEQKQIIDDYHPQTTWDKIKDTVIKWAVPLVMAAILFYISEGK